MRFLLLLPLLVACTTSPQGKSIDYANYADLGSTGIALAAGGNEMNPLGVALVPLKLGMGKGVEKVFPYCNQRKRMAGYANTFYLGATANNLLVAMSAGPAAPVVGVATGIGVYMNRDKVVPSCDIDPTPEMEELLEAYAQAWVSGDVEALSALLADDVVVSHYHGKEAVTEAYRAYFATHTNRSFEYTKSVWTQDPLVWGRVRLHSEGPKGYRGEHKYQIDFKETEEGLKISLAAFWS